MDNISEFLAAEPCERALIFDMDGVICHTMPYHLEAWRIYVERTPELRQHINLEQLRQMGGKRNAELLPELLGRPVSEAEVQRWGAGKEAVFRELLAPNLELLPGLLPFLKSAKEKGYRLGLGTSACAANVELVLSCEGVGDFFDTVVMEQDVQRGKPDPECYLLVAERLQVLPQHCLVFEDAVAGVLAAVRAGMHCWGVLTTQSETALQAAGAEVCIEDFTDPRLQRLLP
ncbi:HAD family hydrolase [Thermosynechococcus sp.]|uniref:HAD family hydrolase n=1 Tax=Thermosynechococcus sp. TaxID=2814275 RepID=UPI00391D2B12